jgi:NAD(P)-dependent dehydrogenase (short-subunit alcohol dehydrogenase family)
MAQHPWALVLGASSGIGGATARALAAAGYHIAGVHLDRRATLPLVEAVQADIRACGREACFFNHNAADAEARAATIAALRESAGPGGVGVLVHSLAFGAMRPYVGDGDLIAPQHFAMTHEVMANSLVYWTQALLATELMGAGGRIFALTSAGSHRVWPAYGAVSTAKALLEGHIRQLAVELAPREITVNGIQAGVTDTPALRKVPTAETMLAHARGINPHGRLTTPDDIARAIVALAVPGTAWMTGNVIRVDGGEDIIG